MGGGETPFPDERLFYMGTAFWDFPAKRFLYYSVRHASTMWYMPKVQRSIRLSPECDEALRVMAGREGRSVSQLLDRLVRMQFIGRPGERSSDGRESAETKAAREKGLYWPDPEKSRQIQESVHPSDGPFSKRFYCRQPSCQFSAPSPKATCSLHGGKLVER